jgi:hypothetical protein
LNELGTHTSTSTLVSLRQNWAPVRATHSEPAMVPCWVREQHWETTLGASALTAAYLRQKETERAAAALLLYPDV